MTDEDKREKLKEETMKSYEKEKEKQEDLKQAIAEDHGQTIETETNLAGDVTVTLKTKLEGGIIDRMMAIDETVNDYQNGDADRAAVSNIPDEMTDILAEITESDAYGKTYWYEVYEETGLIALYRLFETAMQSLQDEMDRMQGAVDGFRQKQ